MFGRASLASPCADGRDVSLVPLFLRTIGLRCELDQCVQWNVHPGALCLILLHKIGVNAAQDRLMGDDKNILTALELHDDGFKADDNVTI